MSSVRSFALLLSLILVPAYSHSADKPGAKPGNKPGQLSVAGRNMIQAQFNKMDTNRDGVIDPVEAAHFFRGPSAQPVVTAKAPGTGGGVKGANPFDLPQTAPAAEGTKTDAKPAAKPAAPTKDELFFDACDENDDGKVTYKEYEDYMEDIVIAQEKAYQEYQKQVLEFQKKVQQANLQQQKAMQQQYQQMMARLNQMKNNDHRNHDFKRKNNNNRRPNNNRNRRG